MTAFADTSVLIDYLQGHALAAKVLEDHRAAGPLHASEITRLEILAGMRPGEESPTRSLLSALIWHPVDTAVAEQAGALGRQWLPSHHTIDSADLAIAIVFLEMWRSMQNVQSNALVAATIILAFVAFEERKNIRGALWIGIGAAIKIFPVLAGIFALPTRSRWRAVAAASLVLGAVLLLPLLVTSPAMSS